MSVRAYGWPVVVVVEVFVEFVELQNANVGSAHITSGLVILTEKYYTMSFAVEAAVPSGSAANSH